MCCSSLFFATVQAKTGGDGSDEHPDADATVEAKTGGDGSDDQPAAKRTRGAAQPTVSSGGSVAQPEAEG